MHGQHETCNQQDVQLIVPLALRLLHLMAPAMHA